MGMHHLIPTRWSKLELDFELYWLWRADKILVTWILSFIELEHDILLARAKEGPSSPNDYVFIGESSIMYIALSMVSNDLLNHPPFL